MDIESELENLTLPDGIRIDTMTDFEGTVYAALIVEERWRDSNGELQVEGEDGCNWEEPYGRGGGYRPDSYDHQDGGTGSMHGAYVYSLGVISTAADLDRVERRAKQLSEEHDAAAAAVHNQTMTALRETADRLRKRVQQGKTLSEAAEEAGIGDSYLYAIKHPGEQHVDLAFDSICVWCPCSKCVGSEDSIDIEI